MTETRRVTVADVAAQAGVSTSTVSRALSGRGYVAPAVRRRILATATRIGYVPDLNARSLRAGSRRDVGVLVSDLRDPFYAELAAGVEAGLRAGGYNMLLINDGASRDQEAAAVRTLLSVRVPGVVLTPVSRESVDMLLRYDVKVVQADRVFSPDADAVVSDNEAGARAATAGLIRHGHRHIALLLDEQTWTTGAGRLAGYRAALTEAGLSVDDALIVTTGLDPRDMTAALRALLADRTHVTALFAANSVLTQVAFRELQSAGRAMPGEISLVGYDDVTWMGLVRPQVSTVAQHAEAIGQRGAELLVSRLDQARPGPVVRELIVPTLRERSSSGPVRP